MSRRALIITIIVTAVLLLPVLLIMEENWRGKHAWENCKRDLEAHGEHLDYTAFIPPPVPDDRNFLLNPLFVSLFDDSAMGGPSKELRAIKPEIIGDRSLAPKSKGSWAGGMHRFDLQEWQTFYRKELHDVTLDKSPAEDVLAALARFDPVFATLRKANAERPLARAPLKYEKGFTMSLQYYSPMQVMIHVLSLRIRAELELGRTDDALADLELGFRFLESIHDDPLLISGLVRMTYFSLLMQPLWEGIAAHRWNDAQLEKIQSHLRRLDFLEDFQRTMRGERAFLNATWNRMLTGQITATQVFWADDKTVRIVAAMGRVFPGLLYQNRIATNMLVQEKILPVVDVKSHRANVRQIVINKQFFDDNRNFGPYNLLARNSASMFLNLAQKYVYTQAEADLAYVACSIERHRIANGRLPATLDDLQMPDLPHDVITGAPLHYKVTGDDYLLYSVGWNGVDDGGTVIYKKNTSPANTVDYTEGDWVWSLKPLPGANP